MSDKNQIVLKNVRISYAKIFVAEGFGDSNENKKFSANFLLDKEEHSSLIDKMKLRIMEMLKEKKSKLSADKICLKDGDFKDGEEYEGSYFISASNATRPQVLRFSEGKNVAVTKEDAEEADILYSGCYVDAVIRLWFQDNKFGKRINASLEVVRYRRAGERFGLPSINADNVLDDLDEELEDDNMFA